MENALSEVINTSFELNEEVCKGMAFTVSLIEKYCDAYPRRTEIMSIEKVDVREAAQRNLKLHYDRETGYLGYSGNGNVLFDVSQYDRVLVIRKTGTYSVIDVPERLFVDKGMLYCGFVDAETSENTIFTVVYKNEKGHLYVKRCRIEKYILNKGYSIVPENCTVIKLTTDWDLSITVTYKPRARIRLLQETFRIADYAVKGAKARGVRLSTKEVKSIRLEKNVS